MHPSASQVMLSVVWLRYVFMTAEMINTIDDAAIHGHDEDLCEKTEAFCLRLEKLMAEWNLEILMQDKSTTETLRYLIADHVMTVYAIIIGMKRLVKRTGSPMPVDTTTLRAARKVAQITLDFTIGPLVADTTRSPCIQYV
jgi:hypothetical protein